MPTASLLAALGLALAALAAQDAADRPPRNVSGGPLAPEQACYDVLHYGLELTVDPATKSIEGACAITFWLVAESPSVKVDLDRRLEVRSVTIDGEPVEFERTTDALLVPTEGLASADRHTLVVAYGGEPRVAPRAPWDGGFVWSEAADGSPWIATANQGEGADLWWPCKDHPSDEADSMDIAVTLPETLVLATNGRFVELEAAGDGWRTHRWRVSTPINSYGVALNIAPYVRLDADYTGVDGEPFPVSFWVLPENEEQGRAFLPEITDHLRWYEETVGPYPFRIDKYGVVETPHLGMEHQSIIAYGNRYGGDPNFDYDWLHHHELAHEWWANLVTARDWNDFWIHEGIGTYMQALYLEDRFGAEALAEKMAIDRGRIANRGPVAPRGARTTRWMYFGGRDSGSPGGDIYSKGSWVCHNLRWLLGDEAFFRVLRRWAYPDPALERVKSGAQCRFATTDELLEIAERECGVELDWYFEVVLRRAALPALEQRLEDGELRLRWSAPTGEPYPMPVEVRIGDELVRVPMEGGAAQLPVGRAEVELDPNRWLLREGDR